MVHRYRVCAAALLCALLGLVVLVPAGALASVPPYQTCNNVILNGGFETGGNWALGPDPLAPVVVASPVHGGSFAMQMGSPAATTQVANSWIYQRISIPSDAVSADLSFWVWLQSAAGPGTDVQQALLMIPGSIDLSLPYQVLWSTQANMPAWQKVPVSLLSQRGRTLDLYFNVYNDGAGGNSAMVLDDVTLTICRPLASATPWPTPTATLPPGVTPWPTPTPTSLPGVTPWPTPSPLASGTPSPGATPWPTPAGSVTPTPPDCIQLIRNGGFEASGDWQFGQDPLLPFYNSNAAFVHSGARSMAQGAVNQTPVTTPAFSSIRQDVTLPSWADRVSITFWYYAFSNAPANGFNRQELILLNPMAYDETVEVLWRRTENGQQWLQPEPIDLSQYRGQTLSVYFNARNAGDGTWTGMYLDDVSLLACGSAVVTIPVVATAPATAPAMEGIQAVPAPSAGETVISVSPVPTTDEGAFPAPTASNGNGNDEPRSSGPSLLDRLGSAGPLVPVIIITALALLAVFGVVLLMRRQENRQQEPEVVSEPEPTDTTEGS